MLPSAIRKLSCNPVLRDVAGRLHLSHLARRVYCRLLARDGLLRTSCLGVEADFKAENSKQLAFVDYILTTEMDFIEAALQELRPGETFLDVGCHYGIFSILASKIVGPNGHVVSVEPHPGALKALRGNIDVNRCKNVEVLNAAFSDSNRTLSLSFNENGAGPKGLADPDSSVHAVEALAGDTAFRDKQVPSSVKIDVEGHEFAVLKGLKQTLSNHGCRRLCVEVHPDLLPPETSRDGIIKFIDNCGFHSVRENIRPPVFHVIATKSNGQKSRERQESRRQ
jgi:FkbM family methyltransferase